MAPTVQELRNRLATISANIEPIARDQPLGGDVESLAYAVHNLIHIVRDALELLEQRGGEESL